MLPSHAVYPIILCSRASWLSVLNCGIIGFESSLSSLNNPVWNQSVSWVVIWVLFPESVVQTLAGEGSHTQSSPNEE